MTDNSNDETNFRHELVLTDSHVSRLYEIEMKLLGCTKTR